MGWKPRERCGVVGVASSSSSVASYIYLTLRALQHRGQESAGIAVYNRKVICKKDLGLVADVFGGKGLSRLKGSAGIGHVYYSIRLSKPENAQPHVIQTAVGDIALAHNGIIVNSEALKNELRRKGHVFMKGSEEEAIAYILSDEMQSSGDFLMAIKRTMRRLVGSYSLTVLFDGRVFGLRDPQGIKPLCFGKFEDGFLTASETVALDVLGAELVRDVKPGEVVEVGNDGYETHHLLRENNTAHCFFEYVYFARADSVIDGRSVYEVRKRIGQRLAREHPVEADRVIPIPDSGRTHAYGYSLESGIPLSEGIMKNRYVARTFIMPDQQARDMSVLEKVNPIRSVIRGRRIVLVDDSIVRGTTMRRIVQIVRDAGAKEVHVRIGSPPIIAPCYLGIDMTTRDQFLARGKSIEHIASELGADSVGYISVQGVVDAIGLPMSALCLGCVTKRYPVSIPGEMHRFQKTLVDFGV